LLFRQTIVPKSETTIVPATDHLGQQAAYHSLVVEPFDPDIRHWSCSAVPNMDVLGWIVVGFIAGGLSGAVVERGPKGCLANTVIGILGGLFGGWFATEQLHSGPTSGFIGALVVAFLGAVIIRLILDAIDGDSQRN
jgi:uncharacterized membrane protein YeaQ/YmgE (transglycosylase-associated protein family)